MGEYERSERIGADIERTANTVNPSLPPIELGFATTGARRKQRTRYNATRGEQCGEQLKDLSLE